MGEALMLEPGDVFATRGRSVVSRLIRFFTRSFGEKRTRVNHVGLVVVGGLLQDVVVVEALSRVRRHKLLSRYGKGGTSEVAVFRPLNLDEDQKRMLVAKAESYVGRKYGWGKVVAHFADWLLLGAYVFRRFTQGDEYPICSWLVAHAFKAVGKHFGKPAGAASPDDIWDFMTTHPDKYREVVPLGLLDN